VPLNDVTVILPPLPTVRLPLIVEVPAANVPVPVAVVNERLVTVPVGKERVMVDDVHVRLESPASAPPLLY
jgi:hypothetical protein